MGIRKLKNPKAFIHYFQTTDNFYEKLENYNLTKKSRVLRMSGDMVVDMESNKTLGPIVTELFLRGRKLDISCVFLSQSYLKVCKIIKLNLALFYHENS